MFRLVYIWTLLFFISITTAKAQYYSNGELPASVKWSQIRTEHFKIIFPSDYSQEAIRTAQIAESSRELVSEHLGKPTSGRLPIIINNRNVSSNGVTTWAPRRIELYSRPSQSKYPGDWTEQLILHEYRHAVQMSQLDQGLLRIGKYLAGEHLIGAAAMYYLKWFLEGDATFTETRLSNTGRGRTPSFGMDLRTELLASSKKIKYGQIRYGSFRRPYPNSYTIGYELVSDIVNQYGEDAFAPLAKYIARKPYTIFPFSLSLKQITGFNSAQYYHDWYNRKTQELKSTANQNEFDMGLTINQRNDKAFTSYKYPHWMNDTTLVVEKTGMAQTREWVKINTNGKEKVIYRPGNVTIGDISVTPHYMVWAEQVSDKRWSWQSFSELRLLDFEKHNVMKGKKHTSYYSPCISPDEQYIATIEIEHSNQFQIVVMDINMHNIIHTIPFPLPQSIVSLSWSKDGQSLYYIRDCDEDRFVEKLNLETKQTNIVYGPTKIDLKNPIEYRNLLFVSGDFGSVANIYAIDMERGVLLKVTNSKYGAFYPDPNPNVGKLAYSDYSIDGYNINYMDIDTSQWTEISEKDYSHLYTYQKPKSNIENDFQVTPYKKINGLFHPHSWLPFYFDDLVDLTLSDPRLNVGAMIQSQSLTNDMMITLGYKWDKTNSLHGKILYKGIYPVLETDFDLGGKDYEWKSALGQTVFSDRTQYRVMFKTYIPFDFTSGYWTKNVTPLLLFNYDNSKIKRIDDSYTSSMSYIAGGLNFSIYSKLAQRDLYPKYGFYLKTLLMSSPFAKEDLGGLYLGQTCFYMPGMFKHNSLRISGGIQYQDIKRFAYNNQMAGIRGYGNGTVSRIDKLSIDYAFPIAYPDLSITDMVYIKRLYANLFADTGSYKYSWAQFDGIDPEHMPTKLPNINLSSFGMEFMVDGNFFGLGLPISVGLRSTYRTYDNKMDFGLKFNADLSAL